MPRLLLFLPCERAIIDRSDNTVSLISVMQQLNADVLTGMPKNAKATQRWNAVAVWMTQPGDEGKRFQQRVTLTNPDGKLMLQALTEFEMTKHFHHTIGRVGNFPIGVPGVYELGLDIRELGQEQWTPVSAFPVLLQHRSVPKPQSAS
jgi:hypothetical protein